MTPVVCQLGGVTAKAPRIDSDFDVLPNIPAELHRPTVLGTIGLLRLVADVDNGEVQGEAVR